MNVCERRNADKADLKVRTTTVVVQAFRPAESTRPRLRGTLLCLSLLASGVTVGTQTGSSKAGEWRDYGGDKGYTKYSPLDQIGKDNVGRLRIAWRRPAVAGEYRAGIPQLAFGNSFRSTPLMIGGVLYA